MLEVKPFLSIEEQLGKLKEKGLIVNDEEVCKKVLEDVGYYHFVGYLIPFKKNNSYDQNISFETIYKLYEFDRELRNFIYSIIEIIEIYFKSKLSYYHAKKYGPLGYKDSANFNTTHKHDIFMKKCSEEINNNKEVLFVKHHLEKYNGNFPLWALMELFTFGNLSYFYNDLLTHDKKEIANYNYKNMSSWLRCCTDLRNICAHYGRLYYRIFAAVPAGLNLEDNSKRKLWANILVLKNLYPDAKTWNKKLRPKLKLIIKKYNKYIDLANMGFPNNWYKLLIIK